MSEPNERDSYKRVLEMIVSETSIAGELKFASEEYGKEYREAVNLKINIMARNVLDQFKPQEDKGDDLA